MQTMPAHRFRFYLLPGFSLHGFSAALEVLRLANGLAGERYAWMTISEDGAPVRSGCGMRMAVDGALSDAREAGRGGPEPCTVVICGGDDVPAASTGLTIWLRSCHQQRMTLSGIAGGVYALARAGLLEGRRAAVHWRHFPDFSERFPEARASQAAFEIDGMLQTCAGGPAAFDMLLRQVEADCGRATANRICEIGLAERVRAPGERQRLPLQTRIGIDNPVLIEMIAQMEAGMAEPLPLASLCAHSRLSRRQVERLFRQEMGLSPARYYVEMRLERAYLLLSHSSLSMIEIAIACGFGSPSHFSRTYRSHYGCTPQQTRQAEAERRRSCAEASETGQIRPIRKVARSA